MATRTVHVFPGERVVTTAGRVVTVAYVTPAGVVMAFGPRGMPVPVRVVADAWGGEHDQAIGLAA